MDSRKDKDLNKKYKILKMLRIIKQFFKRSLDYRLMGKQIYAPPDRL
jgi:hypothetical protein